LYIESPHLPMKSEYCLIVISKFTLKYTRSSSDLFLVNILSDMQTTHQFPSHNHTSNILELYTWMHVVKMKPRRWVIRLQTAGIWLKCTH